MHHCIEARPANREWVQMRRGMNQALAEMFRYNRWANRALFGACRALTPEQLQAQPPGISGTIGELLTHIAGSQQTFILRTQGRQHEGELGRSSPWPGIDTVIEVVMRTSDELVAIAESLDADTDVNLPYFGKVYRFPQSFFLVHALEHGVEHRTEVKAGLAQLGIETPDLDGWAYSMAAGYGQEVKA
jgi:uncharacterized damage-inducible protein DinB